jgi:hypothetical protein
LAALLVMKSGQFLELRRFSAFIFGLLLALKSHRLSPLSARALR